MPRAKKAGLDYFPLDTGFFEDKRIRRLISRFGADGAAFYIYILCKAYEGSYFVKADDDFKDDAALDLNCSVEKIGLMLHYLLDKSLLDGTLFSTVKVLSSHGIQTQYQKIKKDLKRDIEVDGDSWILKESETEGFIKVRNSEGKSEINHDKSGINSDKYGINAIKERKEKERKGKEREEGPTAGAAELSGRSSDPGSAVSFFLDRVNPKAAPRTIELLSDFEQDLGPEVCIRAMMEALDKGKGNWGYIQGILRNKRRDGIRSLAAWDAQEAQRQNKKNGKEKQDGTESGTPLEFRVGDWL